MSVWIGWLILKLPLSDFTDHADTETMADPNSISGPSDEEPPNKKPKQHDLSKWFFFKKKDSKEEEEERRHKKLVCGKKYDDQKRDRTFQEHWLQLFPGLR